MSLDGSLEDFGLSDVLQLIHIGKRTGVLTVTKNGDIAKVYFQDGEAVHATLNEEVGEPAVFQLFNWTKGTFHFETQIIPSPKTITIGSQNLILEATRHIDEWAKLRTLIPSRNTVLGFSPNPREGSENITLEPHEWRILSLVDGRRTVTKIAELSGFNELKTVKILYGLVSSGLLEVVEEEAVVDKKKIEEALEEEKGALLGFLTKVGGAFARGGGEALEEEFKTKIGIVVHFLNKYIQNISQSNELYNPVKLPWKLEKKVKEMVAENYLVNELVVKDGAFDVRETERNTNHLDELSKQEILRSLSRLIDEIFNISIKQSNKLAAIRRYKSIYEKIFCEGRAPADLGLEAFIASKG